MKPVVDLQNVSSEYDIPSQMQFEQWSAAALESQRDQAECTIRIVEEAESADLNQAYRGKLGPTNVLSFPFEQPEGLDELLPLIGDLVICAPVVKREAQQQGKTELAHWAHMVVHGTLHLIGYDHIEEHDAEQMESIEREVMARLGFDNPYEEE